MVDINPIKKQVYAMRNGIAADNLAQKRSSVPHDIRREPAPPHRDSRRPHSVGRTGLGSVGRQRHTRESDARHDAVSGRQILTRHSRTAGSTNRPQPRSPTYSVTGCCAGNPTPTTSPYSCAGMPIRVSATPDFVSCSICCPTTSTRPGISPPVKPRSNCAKPT